MQRGGYPEVSINYMAVTAVTELTVLLPVIGRVTTVISHPPLIIELMLGKALGFHGLYRTGTRMPGRAHLPAPRAPIPLICCAKHGPFVMLAVCTSISGSVEVTPLGN